MKNTHRKQKYLFLAGAVLALVFFSFSVFAQTVSNGDLVDISIYLVNNQNEEISNGEYDVRFAIYSTNRTTPDPTDSDVKIWQETQKVKMQNGVLRTSLGLTTPLPNVNFLTGQYYLGVKIGTDSEMVPRKKVNSVFSALNAGNASTANSAASLNGAVTGTAQGNIPLLGTGGKFPTTMIPNITKLGTVTAGVWQATAIANGYIANALTGKTYNGLTLTSNADGFSIAGGSTKRTLTILSSDVSINQNLLTTSSPIFAGLTLNGNINVVGGNYLVNGAPLGSGMGGSGTAGYLPKFTAGTTIGNSLIYDTNTRIGIGTSSPSEYFSVGASSQFRISSAGIITAGQWQGTVISVQYGGTGTNTFTPNGILFGSGTGAIGVSASGSVGQFLVVGAGGSPEWASYSMHDAVTLGAGESYLSLGASQQITAGKIVLTRDIFGILATVNGGTGTSYLTPGQIIFGAGTGAITSSSNFYFDNVNNRVGIGTTIPSEKLEIENIDDIYFKIHNTVAGSSEIAGIKLQVGTSYDSYTDYHIKNKGGNLFFDQYNDSGINTRLFIDRTSGYVGLGTTSPSYTLDVAGTFRVSDGICIGADCRSSWATAGPISGSGVSNGLAYWSDADTLGTSATGITGQILLGVSGSAPTWLGVGTSGQYLQTNGAGVNPAWITPPSITISGQSYLTANDHIITAGLINLGTNVSGILPVANGGLGSASFSQYGILLGGGGTAPIGISATGITGQVLMGVSGLAPTWSSTPAFNGSLLTNLNASSFTSGIMSVAYGGIGTSYLAPGQILFGAGTGAIGTSASFFFDNSNGRIGIGTTSPTDKLDVAGGVKIGSLLAGTSTTALTDGLLVQGGITIGSNSTYFSMSLSGSKLSIYPGWTDTNAFTIDSNGVTSISNLEMGALNFETNGGILSWIDMPVSSGATYGTVESYTAMLDGNPMLTIFGRSNGSGGVQNLGIGIGTTSPTDMLDVAGGIKVGAGYVGGSVTAPVNGLLIKGNVAIGSTGLTEGKLHVSYVASGSDTLPQLALQSPIVSGSASIARFIMGTTNDIISNNGGRVDFLAIRGASSSSTNLNIALSPSGNSATVSRFFIKGSNGYVGLGTTIPTSALSVAGGIRVGSSYASIGSTAPTNDSWFQGKIGVGTTNPTDMLDIVGGVKIGQSSYFGSNTAPSNGLLIQGNVGIGTTSPEEELEIIGSSVADIALRIRNTSSSGYATIMLDNNLSSASGRSEIFVNGSTQTNYGGASSLNLITYGNNPIAFFTNYQNDPTERMRIANYGYFGIGTTNPTAILSIAGGIRVGSSYASIGSTAATNDSWFQGKIGVGTTNPTDMLDIAGGVKIGSLFAGMSTTAPANGMLIQGNVGIGTTNATAKLTIDDGSLLIRSGNLILAGTSEVINDPTNVYVSGRYAYVTSTGNDNLQVFDVSNPASPILAGTSPTITNPYGLAVSGKYAYVAGAGSSYFQIFDVSNPSNIISAGTSPVISKPAEIYISGKYAYVTSDDPSNGKLEIFDISNPSNIILAGTSPFIKNALGIDINGNYAYIGGFASPGGSLAVVNIADPQNPIISGTEPFTPGGYVAVSGQYAYVTTWSLTDGYLKIFDISNPQNLISAGSFLVNGRPRAIHIAGKYAYVGNMGIGGSNIQVFDVSNPANPILAGTSPSNIDVHDLYVSGKYVYATHNDGATGNLQVFEIPGIDAPAASIGNLASNDITVSENVDIGNNLYVRNGINVGSGGILSDGGLSVGGILSVGTSATSGGVKIGTGFVGSSLTAPVNGMIIQGNVGIGTSSATDKLDITGGVKIGSSYAGMSTTAPTNGLLIQGKVGIGTTAVGSSYQMEISGNLKVGGTLTVGSGATYPDYVFESYYGSNYYNPNYTGLMPISELESYLRANYHLPGMISASDAKNGFDLVGTTLSILEKTEENTLYAIQNYNKIKDQELILNSFRNSLYAAYDKDESLMQNIFQEEERNKTYDSPGNFQEVVINKIDGVNLENYDLDKGYLSYDLYLENAENLNDFNTEFGNQMDQKEIQWIKANHPYFQNGWNQVKLPIRDGMKTGTLNQSDLNYFRIYFKFSQNNQVKIKSIQIQAPLKTNEDQLAVGGTNAGDILTINEINFDLNTETGQKESIKYQSENMKQINTDLAEIKNLAETINSQMDLIKAQNETIMSFYQTLNPESLIYKDLEGNLNLADGELEAGGIVAGMFTIKVKDENSRTIGETVVCPIGKKYSVEEKICLDDSSGDGQSVIILTSAVSESAKIFTNFENNPGGFSWTEKIKDAEGIYSGFKIMLSSPVESGTKVNWWIIQEESIK